MFKLLFYTLLATCFLSADEDSQTLYVQLETESPLLPLYIVKTEEGQSSLSPDYVKQLETILKFDLGHNGMTSLAASNQGIKQLEKQLSFTGQVDLSPWMKEKIYFIVQPRIQQRTLGARLYIVNSNQIKMVDGLQLTGTLSEDRRTLHQLADTIHKALFNENGIASTKILYTVKKEAAAGKKRISEVYEADYDGGNARQITNTNAICVTPSYIPPREGRISRSFVFVSYEMGQPKIYFGDLETGKTQRATLLKGNQLMPVISNQRDKMAFISDITGNPDLFLQNYNSESGLIEKPRQLYATHKATQSTPTFSPDGKKIAFVSNKDGSPRIYLLTIPPPGTSIKDTKAQLISKTNRENSAPCWSPDGTKLAYCSMTKGARQIWIYDFQTGKERQLTQGPGNKENPSWAPNSLHLVFNSSDANASELYVINLNQPEAVRITSGKGEKHFPAWEPRFNSKESQ